jgi:hypothetical protein
MENENIIKAENQKEVVQIFRKIVASGVINKDAAITKILRDYPHFFHQPTPDDIAKISRSELNDEIRRRARQPNKLTIDLFANVPPTDKKPV